MTPHIRWAMAAALVCVAGCAGAKPTGAQGAWVTPHAATPTSLTPSPATSPAAVAAPDVIAPPIATPAIATHGASVPARGVDRPASQRVVREAPLDVLAAANGAARQRPAQGGFHGARQVFSYAPGAIFELYANPAFISTILLEPGETVSDIAAGDTSRWMVSEARTEADREERAIVLVKPHAAGLRTNLVIVTNRRTYLVEARSTAGDIYAAQVAWSYPAEAAPAARAAARHFGYRLRTTKGRTPAWMPARVYDDGRRTWIEFNDDIVAHEMAPLFVITPEGAELVNYRVQGARYVVDRIFDAAELRMGRRAPVVVRIERTGQRARAHDAARAGAGR